jgi:hypothetical protein
LNPALLSYVIAGPRARLPRRSGRHRGERRISNRLEAEAIERLVAEYAGGTTAADLDLINGTASPRAVCCGWLDKPASGCGARGSVLLRLLV